MRNLLIDFLTAILEQWQALRDLFRKFFRK